MPDPNDTGTSTVTPPAGPSLEGLRVRAVQPAPESTFQTVKRNLTPELDTSNAAKGPGHEFENDSPQAEGEQQYREAFGNPLEQAYGHAKKFLETHSQQLSEKVLAPFRTGLDNIADELQQAAESGHIRSGGALTQPTRALAEGAGAALRMVPVGKDVKETALMSVVPPELGPEGKALSKEIKAGESVAEKAAPNLEGLRTREVSPAPQKSPFRIAAETPEKHAEFQEAVKSTEGAELHDKGLTLDVARQQKPEQAGERAIRTGVFFLPEKKSPYQRYYTTSRQGYGGSQRIEGRTTFENPIIAKGASGGKVPERAYDAINGPGAYDEMRQDVLDATTHSFGYGAKDPKVLTQRVADVLEKHGGNPDLAEDIVRTSKEGNTLPYAVQEHIVAASVRKAGHDGIIGYSKVKGQHRLSEVFDLRRDKYPISSQLFEASPTSPGLAGIRTREVSPTTAVESKVASPAKEVPKSPQHEAVGIHNDDLPSRAKYQDVDFSAQDLQDSAKKVTPETIRKDYAGGKKDVSVYQAHIPMEDLPSAKFVEPEEENFDRGEYNRPRVGVPIKVAVNKDNSLEILDGNHRVQTWEEQGQQYAPAWVIDRRGPGIEKLSEDELAERAEIEEEERQVAQQKAPAPKAKAGSQTEQPSIYTPEGAQPLAEKLGAKVVGSVTKKESERVPNAYGSTKPRDLDLRIEGEYKPEETNSKMKEAGFEPAGSSLVSPEEVKQSGKPYGKPGWKRAEHFENAAGEKIDVWHDEAEKSWAIHDLGKEHNIPSEEGYLYHATNHDRARDIAESGLDTHKPSYGTDQEAWPDGSTDKRSYFTKQADSAWQFSPEEGKPALLRMKQDPAIHSRESTGDFYSKKKIPANKIEVLGDDKQWHPVSELSESKAAAPQQKERWTRDKGSIPGEPMEYLDIPSDGDYNKAKAVIVERETPKGSRFEASTGDFEHIGIFKTPAEARAAAEKYFGSSKAGPKAATEPKVPLHEKLFSEALKGQEKTSAKNAERTTLNASGESSASQEAINRASSEKATGTKRVRIDTRSGAETPIIGPDAVDAKASP